MWAVVEISKKQYLVSDQQDVQVEKLTQADGEIVFDTVLIISDNDKVLIGTPYIKGASVKAAIVGALKGPKVISFKYRKRKKSRRKRGHRQNYTLLKIAAISYPST